MKAVHLPFYDDNLYQSELMHALGELGVETIRGGGGGTFGRIALQQWKPDILHFHWLHPYMVRPSSRGTVGASLFLLAQVGALKARGTKIVWTAHNIQSHESPFPRLERRLQRRFLRSCDAIIAHCEGAKRDVVRTFSVSPDKVWVVPHGNYIGAYPNTVSRAQARQKLDLPLDAPVFGFVGQIRPYKGVFELVAAFKQLLDENPPKVPLLLIAGKVQSEAEDEQLRAAIGDCERIRFAPGFVPDDELQTWLGASDAMVFPYRDILTSGAVLLAMSFGRACVAPRRGCLSETLDSKGGFLYDPDEPNALLAALRTALSRQDELNTMGEHNFERARQWSWEFVARQTNEVYRRVLGD